MVISKIITSASRSDIIILYKRPSERGHNPIYSYFEKGCRQKCARDDPEREIWDMINTHQCSRHCGCQNYLCCFHLARANIYPWPLMPFYQICLKNSELKTTHNTFRDCRVHFSNNLSRNSCIYCFSGVQGGQRGGQASVECFIILQKIIFCMFTLFFQRTAVLFHAVDPKTNKVVDKDIVIE